MVKTVLKIIRFCDVPLLNKFHHDEISLSDLHTNVFGDVTCIQVKPDSL